jgi:hypothetical protein
MPPINQGAPLMSKKPDLGALFIVGTNGVKFSFLEILLKAKHLVNKEGYFAGPVLHKIYFEITGRSHLSYSGQNSKDLPVYTSRPDYKELSDRVLNTLEEESRAFRQNKVLEDYASERVVPELARGVDAEVLTDIGY